MKKVILSIFLSFISICTSYASTTLNYSNSAPMSDECPSEAGVDSGAGARTLYGVPQTNGAGIDGSASITCITHYYYTSGDTTKTIVGASGTSPTYPNGITNCGAGERVVGMSGGNITCRKYDNTPPLASDIGISTPGDNANLLATNSQNFQVTVSSAGGAPINTYGSIKAFFEDYSTSNSLLGTSHEYKSGYNENIQNVDNSRLANGSRMYSLQVAKICDEAGNCTCKPGGVLSNDCVVVDASSNLKSYTYNVYANTLSSNITTKNVSSNQVDDITNIADGSDKDLVISLRDTYGNQIIPASGIGRTVDFNFNVKNSMYLNQQTRSGQSSVFLTSSNGSDYTNKLALGTNTGALDTQSSTNGDYIYKVRVYTPTANQDSLPVSDTNAELIFNNITFDINATQSLLSGDTPQTQVVSGGGFGITKFSPLYYTRISGDLKNGGFIEGAVQDSYIQISTGTGASTSGVSNKKTYLIFSGSGSVPLKFDLKYSKSGAPSTTIGESTPSTDFGDTSDALRTLMNLVAPPAPSNMKAYLSTHIAYTLDTLPIVYNSDIIGKDSYFGVYTSGDANQSGLKVIGINTSKKSTAVIEEQMPNDIKIVGNTDKLIPKTSIVKNGYNFAKNVSGYLGSSTLTSIDSPNVGTNVNNVLYFGAENGNVDDKVYQLGNGGDMGINTNKTILVIGGNLYINSNLYYSSTNGMLGIVVLKDKQGRGGNVYINPDITNIVGSIFAEKSIISYNGTELDGTATQTVLKNQLHIYGNIFSENTIGGSRKSPPECPYYVSASNCDTREKAQKYDLNYLRRYYLMDASLSGGTTGIKIPANNGKIIGGGVCNIYTGACTGGNTSFARNITNTIQPYSNNSTLIEYNPKVQSNPPALFKIVTN